MRNRNIPSLIQRLPAFLLLLLSFSGQAQWTDPSSWQYFVSPENVNDLVDDGIDFWLATDNGVVVWNKTDQTATYYYPYNSGVPSWHISAITRAADGTVWIGTYDNMLGFFDGGDWITEDIPVPADFMEDPLLYDITFGPDGKLYVGTNFGLVVRDGSEWTTYTNEDVPNAFLFDVWQVDVDPATGDVFVQSFEWIKYDGAEWTNLSADNSIIFYGGGRQCMEPNGIAWATNIFSTIAKYENGVTTTYEIFDQDIWEPVTPNSNVINIYSRNGSVYVATQNGKVYRNEGATWVLQPSPLLDQLVEYLDGYYVDEEGKEWAFQQPRIFHLNNTELQVDVISEHGLETGYARTFAQEPGGDFYIVTTDNKLMTYEEDGSLQFQSSPLDTYQFTPYVTEAHYTEDGAFWLATLSGLFRYQDGNWDVWNDLQGNFPSFGARSVAIDPQGNPWVITSDGVYRYENDTWISQHAEIGLPVLDYRQIVCDANGDIWIAELYGDLLLRIHDGEWDGFNYTNTPWNSDAFITFLIPTSEGGLQVIESYRHLYIFQNDSWTSHSIGPDPQVEPFVYQGVQSSEGNMIYSSNMGVITYSEEGWELHNTDNSEMLSNGCFLVGVSGDGALWVSTNEKGIHRMEGFEETTTSVFDNQLPAAPLQVFPNPAMDEVHIRLPASLAEGEVQWVLSDRLGRTLQSGQWMITTGDQLRSIRLDGLSTDMYVLQVRQGNRAFNQMITIQK